MKAQNTNQNANELALREAVQEALGSYDSSVVAQMLVEQGYDPFYAQQLVEEAEDELESESSESVIPEVVEEETTTVEETDPTEEANKAYVNDIQQQAMDDDLEDDEYQDVAEQEYFGFANGGLVKANFGIDVQNMPNAQYSQGEEQPFITWPTMQGDLMRNGGVPNKRSFLKKMTKHLMKANMGMQQNSDVPSPYGDINNPMGNNVSNKQNFLSAVNNQAQTFQAKQQAEQMYNNMYGMAEGGDTMMGADTSTFGPPLDQHDPMEHLNIYGESLSREFQDPTSMETKEMQFGGGFRNRRIRRANRALFGLPIMPPGTSVDYQFGPLGGLRRASAETDLSQLAQMFNMLPGSPNANPFVTLEDMFKQSGYKLLVNQGRLVDKAVSTINNQSIKEVAGATGNQTAEQTAVETPTVSTENIIPAATPAKTTPKTTPKAAAAKPSPKPASPTKTNNSAKVQSTGTKYTQGLPTVGKRGKETPQKPKKKNTLPYNYNPNPIGRGGSFVFEEGGFVDSQNPDLYKFIYGGDDISIPYINDTDMYRNGGYIPQAQDGMSSFDQFRLQKLNPDGSLKNKPTLSGGEELMGNPYRQPQQQPVQPSVIPNSPGNGFQVGQRIDFGQMPGVIPWNTGQQQMNPQQMQMMQQMLMQQMGRMPFGYGAPRGLGLGRAALQGLTGLSRDFNYFTGDNPANWTIPEGYTKLRKETSKDRGKWYSPFDTKRITTYEYSKPGEPGAPGTPGSTPRGGANEYDVRTNTEGLSGRAARAIRQGERRNERQMRRGMEEFPDAFQEGTPNPFAKLPAGSVNMTAPKPPVNPDVVLGNQGRPFTNPTNLSYNLANPTGMRTTPAFEDGGYIPDYYTFDGYLPFATMGIVSDTPDFQNPQNPNSVKYTIEEQSGWSFDPTILGENIGRGANITSTGLEDYQSAMNRRQGANKFNYADDINRELVYRGLTNQEGVDTKVGFESGRTYTGQYGGAKYKSGGQYKTGGVYSLTQDQIDQIRKMGGDVEFI